MENKDKKYYGKKLKYGGLSVAVTAVVIAAVVILNIIISMLMQRSAMKLDLTENKLYELSEQTMDYVAELDTDVKIIVTSDEFALTSDYDLGKYYGYIIQLFYKYASLNSKVSVELVNIINEPEKIKKYTDMYGSDIPEKNVIITSGNKLRINNINELIEVTPNYTTQQYEPTGLQVEKVITPNIMYVTDANPKKVAFITSSYVQNAGYALNQIRNMLYDNAYDVELVDILTQDIKPEVYDLVIVATPTADYANAQIQKLEEFLVNGGNYGKNLIYIADLGQPTLPNIDAFLAQWGLRVENSLIYEEDQSKAQQVQIILSESNMPTTPTPIATVVDENYSKNLNTAKPIVVPYSRPITLLWESKETFTTRSILQTESSARARITSDGTFADEGGHANSVIAVSERKSFINENTFAVSSSIMAIGCANIANPLVVSNTGYDNGNFVINAINEFIGKEAALVYNSKPFATTPLTITQKEVSNIQIFLIFIVPAFVIAIGIYVFVRRKNA